jgi:Zn-dependent protease
MDIVYIATVLGVILISMTLHEAMHAFASYWLGDDTAKLEGRLTLNPIKHIDPFLTILLPLILAISGAPVFGGAKPVPFNPNRVKYDEWGAALVALAGPFTNLLIAFLTFTLYVVVLGSPSGLMQQIFATAVAVNLGFFVFNIIPIPPLDGSRVLYALAPDFFRKGMEVVEQYGLIVVFAIVMLASPLIGSYMAAAINTMLHFFYAIYGMA